MTSLLFRLRGRWPHNSPLLIGPHALAEALNQKGGRGRPSLLRIELAPFIPRPAFQRLGTHRRQCRVIPPKVNSAFVAAIEDVLAVYMRHRDSDRVGMVGR